MAPPTRLSVLLALFLVSGTLGANPSSAEPDTVVYPQTHKQREIAAWALGQFTAADLELPPVIIEFSGPDPADCGNAPARVHLNETPILVNICWNDPFILLHELAHIWEANNVTDTTRTAFMAMRTNVTTWASLNDPWNQRGREHVANVIAWGLLDNPHPISRTYPNDPDNLTAAYRTLTGNEPLHNGGPDIQQPNRNPHTNPRPLPIETGR